MSVSVNFGSREAAAQGGLEVACAAFRDEKQDDLERILKVSIVRFLFLSWLEHPSNNASKSDKWKKEVCFALWNASQNDEAFSSKEGQKEREKICWVSKKILKSESLFPCSLSAPSASQKKTIPKILSKRLEKACLSFFNEDLAALKSLFVDLNLRPLFLSWLEDPVNYKKKSMEWNKSVTCMMLEVLSEGSENSFKVTAKDRKKILEISRAMKVLPPEVEASRAVLDRKPSRSAAALAMPPPPPRPFRRKRKAKEALA